MQLRRTDLPAHVAVFLPPYPQAFEPGNLCAHSAAYYAAGAVAFGLQSEEAMGHDADAQPDFNAHRSGAPARRDGIAEAIGRCTTKSQRSAGQDHESAWPHIDLMPELPLLHELEADTLQSGIQSRPHWVSTTWHASEGRLHAVPHESCVQERKQELRRLPR